MFLYRRGDAVTYPDKHDLLNKGLERITDFCVMNFLQLPEVRFENADDWEFKACAYYRPVYIAICVKKCAAIGVAGMAWSYPGHVVDRTPFGVLAHELGHHVDWSYSKLKGNYYGDFGVSIRRASGEPKLTNYCPNDAEWFAEMFRLFVTNPDLLSVIRPKTFALLTNKFLLADARPWNIILKDAPARTLTAVANRIIRDTK